MISSFCTTELILCRRDCNILSCARHIVGAVFELSVNGRQSFPPWADWVCVCVISRQCFTDDSCRSQADTTESKRGSFEVVRMSHDESRESAQKSRSERAGSGNAVLVARLDEKDTTINKNKLLRSFCFTSFLCACASFCRLTRACKILIQHSDISGAGAIAVLGYVLPFVPITTAIILRCANKWLPEIALSHPINQFRFNRNRCRCRPSMGLKERMRPENSSHSAQSFTARRWKKSGSVDKN